MSIALMITDRDLTQLYQGLKQKLPDVEITSWPTISIDRNVEFAVAWQHPKNMWQLLPNLKVVSSLGAGVDQLVTDKGRPAELTLCRIVDTGLSAQMAEYVLSAVLAHQRQLLSYVNDQQSKQWSFHPRREGKNITILGLGAIGQEVANALITSGFNVSGWSRTKKELDGITPYAGNAELANAVQNADYVVSVLPATPETDDLLNLTLFKEMPSHACLINVGRGQALNEQDLTIALQNELLGFAVLDVFKQEPLPKDHPFWTDPKVLVTPHISAITDQQAVIDQIAENYMRFTQGKALINHVNSDKGY